MEKSIFSRQNMSTIIKECITDLKDGGSRLIDLSHLLHCIGESKNDKVLLACFPIIGSFGAEVMRFRQLSLIPMIPPNLKKKHANMLSKAIKAGQDSLERLRVLLCEKDKQNYKQLVSILGTLNKADYNLAREWSLMTRGRTSGRGPT